MSGTDLIKDQFEKVFYGGAWHGPSVMEALENVSAEKAVSKPFNNAHSIWEIVLHINAWQLCTITRLKGEFTEPSPEEDWPEVINGSQNSWEITIGNLKNSAEELIKSISKLDEHILDSNIAGKDYTYYFLIHGLIQHDIYHVGQIILLKKVLS